MPALTSIAERLTHWNLDQATPLDLSESKPSLLLEADNGASIKVSVSALLMLQHLASGMSIAAFGELVQAQSCRAEDASRVQTMCCDLLGKMDALYDAGADLQLPPFFWLKFTFIPERIVTALARRCADLYSSAGVIAAAGSFVLSWYVFHSGHRQVVHRPDGLYAYLLFVLTLLFHELGHASACARFRVKAKEIGFAIYLLYPVFYTDVTRAWSLPRKQRVIVDVGGCFFQSLAIGCLCLLFLATGWACFKEAVVISLYSMVFMLNPVFLFDGYWIIADALGIHRLIGKPREVLLERFRPASRRQKKTLGTRDTILFLYAAVSILAWSWFTVRIVPFVWSLVRHLINQSATLLSALHSGQRPPLSAYLTLLYGVLLAGMACVTGKMIVQRIVAFLKELRLPEAVSEPAAPTRVVAG